MVRRLIRFALLLAVLSASVHPAYAQNNGNGQGGGGGNGGGGGSDGSPGNSNGAGGSENAASAAGTPAASAGRKGKPDEDVALEAVQSQDAVPFREVLRELRRTTEDKVIDARLFSLGGVLVYELKVLGGDGRVGVYRYDAATGQRMAAN